MDHIEWEVVMPPVNNGTLEHAVRVKAAYVTVTAHGHLLLEDDEENTLAIFRDWTYITAVEDDDDE